MPGNFSEFPPPTEVSDAISTEKETEKQCDLMDGTNHYDVSSCKGNIDSNSDEQVLNQPQSGTSTSSTPKRFTQNTIPWNLRWGSYSNPNSTEKLVGGKSGTIIEGNEVSVVAGRSITFTQESADYKQNVKGQDVTRGKVADVRVEARQESNSQTQEINAIPPTSEFDINELMDGITEQDMFIWSQFPNLFQQHSYPPQETVGHGSLMPEDPILLRADNGDDSTVRHDGRKEEESLGSASSHTKISVCELEMDIHVEDIINTRMPRQAFGAELWEEERIRCEQKGLLFDSAVTPPFSNTSHRDRFPTEIEYLKRLESLRHKGEALKEAMDSLKSSPERNYPDIIESSGEDAVIVANSCIDRSQEAAVQTLRSPQDNSQSSINVDGRHMNSLITPNIKINSTQSSQSKSVEWAMDTLHKAKLNFARDKLSLTKLAYPEDCASEYLRSQQSQMESQTRVDALHESESYLMDRFSYSQDNRERNVGNIDDRNHIEDSDSGVVKESNHKRFNEYSDESDDEIESTLQEVANIEASTQQPMDEVYNLKQRHNKISYESESISVTKKEGGVNSSGKPPTSSRKVRLHPISVEAQRGIAAGDSCGLLLIDLARESNETTLVQSTKTMQTSTSVIPLRGTNKRKLSTVFAARDRSSPHADRSLAFKTTMLRTPLSSEHISTMQHKNTSATGLTQSDDSIDSRKRKLRKSVSFVDDKRPSYYRNNQINEDVHSSKDESAARCSGSPSIEFTVSSRITAANLDHCILRPSFEPLTTKDLTPLYIFGLDEVVNQPLYYSKAEDAAVASSDATSSLQLLTVKHTIQKPMSFASFDGGFPGIFTSSILATPFDPQPRISSVGKSDGDDNILKTIQRIKNNSDVIMERAAPGKYDFVHGMRCLHPTFLPPDPMQLRKGFAKDGAKPIHSFDTSNNKSWQQTNVKTSKKNKDWEKSQINSPTQTQARADNTDSDASKHQPQDQHIGAADLLKKKNRITIISIELFVMTRPNYLPNPKFDAVHAILYIIQDTMSDSETEVVKQSVGIISITDNIARKDKFTCETSNSCSFTKGQSVEGTNNEEQVDASFSEQLQCDVSNKLHDVYNNHTTNSSNTSNQDVKPSKERILLLSYGLPNTTATTIVDNEVSLMKSFIELIRKVDPDFLIGYEVQSSSLGYLIKRAKILDIDMLKLLSKIPDERPSYRNQLEEQKNEADTDFFITGRIVLNNWHLMRDELKLLNYSYHNVASHLLQIRVPKFSNNQLTRWYKNFHTRGRTLKHIYRLTELNLLLIDKIDAIRRISECARLYGIDFASVISRGSQYRVEAALLQRAHALGYLLISPSRKKVAGQAPMEVIPLVMEPQSQFYHDPVVVLDFQSLYPSMMIAYNLCFSTCFGKLRPGEAGDIDTTETLGVIDYPEVHSALASTLGRYSLSNDGVGVDTETEMYLSPNGTVFTSRKVRQGVLPLMLREMLETRVMVKRAMKRHQVRADGSYISARNLFNLFIDYSREKDQKYCKRFWMHDSWQ